jgi:hypothetical protein
MVLKRREGGPGGRVASAGRGGCGGVNLEAPLPQRVLLNGRNLGLANSRSCSVQHAIVQRFSIFFHTKCCRTPRLRAGQSLQLWRALPRKSSFPGSAWLWQKIKEGAYRGVWIRPESPIRIGVQGHPARLPGHDSAAFWPRGARKKWVETKCGTAGGEGGESYFHFWGANPGRYHVIGLNSTQGLR